MKVNLIAMYRFSRERLRRVLRKKAAVILHLHTFTSADLHLHTFTSADLHLHTFTSADLHLHTFTSADLLPRSFTSADLLSLLLSFSRSSFYLSLKGGAVPPERHET